MALRDGTEIDPIEWNRRVASAAEPRPDDICRPLGPGESLIDRLFAMCGQEPPSPEQLERYQRDLER